MVYAPTMPTTSPDGKVHVLCLVPDLTSVGPAAAARFGSNADVLCWIEPASNTVCRLKHEQSSSICAVAWSPCSRWLAIGECHATEGCDESDNEALQACTATLAIYDIKSGPIEPSLCVQVPYVCFHLTWAPDTSRLLLLGCTRLTEDAVSSMMTFEFGSTDPKMDGISA